MMDMLYRCRSEFRFYQKISFYIIVFAVSIISTTKNSYAQERSYLCDASMPDTVASTVYGIIPIIRWRNEEFSLSQREGFCQDVANRFQRFRDNGLLQRAYVRPGLLNNQSVICVVLRRGNPCSSDNLLLTLPSDISANEALAQLFDLAGLRRGNSLELGDDIISYDADSNLHLYFPRFIDFLERDDYLLDDTLTLPEKDPVFQSVPQDTRATAESITVRIDGPDTDDRGGTGVIIRRSGSSYTVRTNWHVVRGNGHYRIGMPDGEQHTVTPENIRKIEGLDVADIEFSSEENYSVGNICDENIKQGDLVYIVGWYNPGPLTPIRLLDIAPGRYVTRLPPVASGAELVFDPSIIQPGMSGGAIITEDNCIVAFNNSTVPIDQRTGNVELIAGIPANLLPVAQDVLQPAISVSTIPVPPEQPIEDLENEIQVALESLRETRAVAIEQVSETENFLEKVRNPTVSWTDSQTGNVSPDSIRNYLIALKSDLELSGQSLNQSRLLLAQGIGAIYELSVLVPEENTQFAEVIIDEIKVSQETDKVIESQSVEIAERWARISEEIEVITEFILSNISSDFRPFE